MVGGSKPATVVSRSRPRRADPNDLKPLELIRKVAREARATSWSSWTWPRSTATASWASSATPRTSGSASSWPGGEAERQANVVVLCSCAPGQKSWMIDGVGRSAFSYFLQKGLAGAARPDDGRGGKAAITVEVASPVRPGRTPREWVAEHRRGAIQTPILLAVGPEPRSFSLPPIDVGPARRRAAEVPAPVATDPGAVEGRGEGPRGRGRAPPAPAGRRRGRLLGHRSSRSGSEHARASAAADRPPYRDAPARWRLYEASLLAGRAAGPGLLERPGAGPGPGAGRRSAGRPPPGRARRGPRGGRAGRGAVPLPPGRRRPTRQGGPQRLAEVRHGPGRRRAERPDAGRPDAPAAGAPAGPAQDRRSRRPRTRAPAPRRGDPGPARALPRNPVAGLGGPVPRGLRRRGIQGRAPGPAAPRGRGRSGSPPRPPWPATAAASTGSGTRSAPATRPAGRSRTTSSASPTSPGPPTARGPGSTPTAGGMTRPPSGSERYHDARALFERVAARLPYYGEWAVAEEVRTAAEPEPTGEGSAPARLAAALASAASLGRRDRAADRARRTSRRSWSGPRPTSASWRTTTGGGSASLASQPAAVGWRDLDDVLATPLISPGERRSLLEQVLGMEAGFPEAGTATATATAGPAEGQAPGAEPPTRASSGRPWAWPGSTSGSGGSAAGGRGVAGPPPARSPGSTDPRRDRQRRRPGGRPQGGRRDPGRTVQAGRRPGPVRLGRLHLSSAEGRPRTGPDRGRRSRPSSGPPTARSGSGPTSSGRPSDGDPAARDFEAFARRPGDPIPGRAAGPGLRPGRRDRWRPGPPRNTARWPPRRSRSPRRPGAGRRTPASVEIDRDSHRADLRGRREGRGGRGGREGPPGPGLRRRPGPPARRRAPAAAAPERRAPAGGARLRVALGPRSAGPGRGWPAGWSRSAARSRAAPVRRRAARRASRPTGPGSASTAKVFYRGRVDEEGQKKVVAVACRNFGPAVVIEIAQDRAALARRLPADAGQEHRSTSSLDHPRPGLHARQGASSTSC